jgi:hypothetical protein
VIQKVEIDEKRKAEASQADNSEDKKKGKVFKEVALTEVINQMITIIHISSQSKDNYEII